MVRYLKKKGKGRGIMMTADERRAKGLLFSPGDPELGRIKRKAHNLNQDYNKLCQDETIS